MSKHSLRGGDVAGLPERFAQIQEKAQARRASVKLGRHLFGWCRSRVTLCARVIAALRVSPATQM